MSPIHSTLIILHVIAGTLGLGIGTIAIINYKKASIHKRYGRYFLWLLSIVVGSAVVGLSFFRINAFLVMLTLLSGYVGYAGYRTVRLRQQRSSLPDVMIALTVLLVGIGYVVWQKQSETQWPSSIIYSTLAAIVIVTVYDLIKYFWLHNQLKNCWIYEHIYKMFSAFSALLSAFMGTILPDWHPYSQLGPSVISLWLMGYFIWTQINAQRQKTIKQIV
ncbi:hypothetical protein [Xanthocytophaga agilis]|uniref:DUF2306 domain-containing protein n=1 Tax=Xanthocytophaga agilis TaxID=3048010 RepID=A0AAE3R993_9BACT|nr:hypothetical protein [Xanthocytophaga agilis]MDJ1503814.1 hypothetical protein [Xanthocytophaga agilis]